MDLALQGFLTIGAFLGLILFARVPVTVALILVPLISVFIGGQAEDVGVMAVDGLKTVAPVAAMMMFAILYFGLMIDVGLFEPLVKGLLRLVQDDPVRLCVVTAILPMLVALDGDGATTFLISVTALLPVHRRLGVKPLVLPTIIGLSAGVMNLLPWGGPTARAMSALEAGVDEIFTPVAPAMLAGIAWVLLAAGFLGWRERRRLAPAGGLRNNRPPPEVGASEIDGSAPAGRMNALFWINLGLTVLLVVLLFQDLYAQWVPLPKMPAPLLFMTAFVIALPINRRTAKAQQEQLAAHAGNVVMVITMICAAGVFAGIMNGAGLITAMAQAAATNMPAFAVPWLSGIVAVTGMPMSPVFTPDAYYFGVLPVFAETAAAVGHDPAAIGRAAILGQMTTGFPLSPLTASTFILIGLSQVSLRDHQKHMFLWAFGTTLVMTAVAALTGAL